MTMDPSSAAPVQAPVAPATAPAAAPVAPAAAPDAPPWGADFDAERAWKLVQDLRSDKEKLAARPVLTDEQKTALAEHDRLVQASKTETQRLQEAATSAQQALANAQADAVRYKVAATHGIPAEHFDLLGTGTEEEITAKAAKISGLLAAQAAPAAVAAPTTRPVTQLRPGATPAGIESEDDVLYGQLFGAQK